MKKRKLLELLKDIEDDTDINETILGIEDFAKSLNDINNISAEDFKQLLANNAEIRGYWNHEKDVVVGNTRKKYEEVDLPKKIEEAVKVKNNEGKEPWEIELAEERAKREALEKQITLEKSKADYSKILSEKKLSPELLDYLPYENGDEAINKVIETFSNIISSGITDGVNSKITENPPIPEAGQGLSNLDGVEEAFFERTGLKL